MCTRMNVAAVLSPTIKIFHRHLGPNLYIFAVKISLWFHRHFMEILWHITAKKHRPSWFRVKSQCAYCTCMEGCVLSFLKAEWKVSDTGLAHWVSSCHNLYLSATFKQFLTEFAGFEILFHIVYMWEHTKFLRVIWLVNSTNQIARAAFTCKQYERGFRNLLTFEIPPLWFLELSVEG